MIQTIKDSCEQHFASDMNISILVIDELLIDKPAQYHNPFSVAMQKEYSHAWQRLYRVGLLSLADFAE